MPSVPLPGDLVAGKYEITKVLGHGGMGVVMEALHLTLSTRVALKFLQPSALTDDDAVKRFDREARAAALVSSPYVTRVLDVDATADGLPFIVMEFVDGVDLASELKRRERIPIAEAVDWVLQACAGMAEAHARGILHRDLKPSNLCLCADAAGPVVKIMDFGVSKIVTAADTATDLTGVDVAVGTPSYMAPEQLIASKTVDHRADVWSLGVVLYRLLAGKMPFRAANATHLAVAIVTEAPALLTREAPDVPRALEAAVMGALEKEAERRTPDVTAFGRAIEPFGTGRFAFAAAVANVPPPRTSGARVSANLAAEAAAAIRAADIDVVVDETVRLPPPSSMRGPPSAAPPSKAPPDRSGRASLPAVLGAGALGLGLVAATVTIVVPRLLVTRGEEVSSSSSQSSASSPPAASSVATPIPPAPDPATSASPGASAQAPEASSSAHRGRGHVGKPPAKAVSRPPPSAAPAPPPDDPLHL